MISLICGIEKKELINKRKDWWLLRWGWGKAKWVKQTNRYKLPVINKSWGSNVQQCDQN